MFTKDVAFLCCVLSVVFSTFGFFPYARELLRVETKTDVQVTVSGWLSWVLADATLLAAMIAKNEVSWQFVPYVVGSVTLIVLCLVQSYRIARSKGERWRARSVLADWNKKDWACVLIVTAACLIWAVKKDPDYATILSMLSLTLGAVLMARDLWRDPRTGSLTAWTLFLTGGIFGVGAVEVWNFQASVPVICVIVQVIMLALCLHRYKARFALV